VIHPWTTPAYHVTSVYVAYFSIICPGGIVITFSPDNLIELPKMPFADVLHACVGCHPCANSPSTIPISMMIGSGETLEKCMQISVCTAHVSSVISRWFAPLQKVRSTLASSSAALAIPAHANTNDASSNIYFFMERKGI